MARSPFINVQAPTSTEPPEHADPVTYAEAGEVFPYRGTETHGVDPTVGRTIDPEEADYGTTVATPQVPEPKEEEPIPVRIVTGNDAKPQRTWNVVREYIRATDPPRRIVGNDETRLYLRIRNLHATDSMNVMPWNNNDANYGYPVPAGTEFVLLNATTEVWARVASAGSNDVPIAIVYELEVSR